MKHSLEERMDIGRRMYLHEITYKEAKTINFHSLLICNLM